MPLLRAAAAFCRFRQAAAALMLAAITRFRYVYAAMPLLDAHVFTLLHEFLLFL